MVIEEISGKLLGAGLSYLGKAVLGKKGEKVIKKITDFLGCTESELPTKLENSEILKGMKELEIKEIEAILKDKDSARNREIEIVKATGEKDTNLYVLAWVVVIGFFALLGILIFVKVPDDNLSILNMVIGSLIAGFSTVTAYFFGSSLGSSKKNKMLGK